MSSKTVWFTSAALSHLLRTQTLISTWMKENWGYCSPDSVRSGIVYPGQSEEEAAMATRHLAPSKSQSHGLTKATRVAGTTAWCLGKSLP